MASPRMLRKVGSKSRPLRVLVMGRPGVGKTALTVRFLTKRFIGEYDSTTEKKYSFQTEVDGDMAYFEIFDTAGQSEECSHLEENIRWADAYIIVYSVTDKVSFNECTQLKFLINHVRKSRRSSMTSQGHPTDIPVALVANKNDLEYDRMVSVEDGQKRCQELGCSRFFDISTRESFDECRNVFVELLNFCRNFRKLTKTNSISFSMISEEPEERREGEKLKRKESVSTRIMKIVIPSSRFKDEYLRAQDATEV